MITGLNLKKEIDIVYLENYTMEMAGKLVSGADIWLNTPLPPFEASGTSGMKAAHNGVINFSVLDGWWIEGCVEGLTGWAIGPFPDQEISEERKKKKRTGGPIQQTGIPHNSKILSAT